MREEPLTFESEGYPCAARLLRPEAAAPAPTIVMAHGFSAVMAQLEPQARRFAAAGFAVLRFDHPNFGGSGGPLPGEVDIARQLAAWRDAVSLAGRTAGCDPARIGLWGSSLSGGHVLQAGALDPRVRAIVAQAPFVDGFELLARRPDIGAFVDRLYAERARRGAGAPATMIPVVAAEEGAPCALAGEAAWNYFGRDPAPSWRNAVTLSSYEALRGYTPGAWVSRIAAPLLMIVAADDAVTPTAHALAAFATATAPRRLVEVPGGHFDVYEGPGFELAIGAAVDWFRTHLA